jgi:hypothetical protein
VKTKTSYVTRARSNYDEGLLGLSESATKPALRGRSLVGTSESTRLLRTTIGQRRCAYNEMRERAMGVRRNLYRGVLLIIVGATRVAGCAF